MIFIFLSVCCSVLVSVLLKLAKRYEIDIRQAIAWNYSIAGLLTWLIFKPEIPRFTETIYPVYIALGLLLPTIFIVLALSVRYTGIVKTDIAQRLSLFIPVLAAFLVFGELFSLMKIAGIVIAFIAIIFSLPWQKQTETSHSYWLYPLIVFIGMGIIDILFKQIAKTENIPFTSSLLVVFILAFILSILYLLYEILVKGLKLTIINLICGWILGIANFGNIVFYLKAHQTLSEKPSVVFSSMNIGVILLGSAVGVLIFKEKLSRLNYAGIVLALISILILSLA
ncbi:MAG: EamA/RhaT family transporter [Daejeonella sp.]|uniref:EamA/RhaT family transporter n=1 Tax=Daejeonella sp. TaxID=2805397 RepID=UPI002733A88E|nr:EamA/RhaT family transporter [Daejeonella sp.]MDP3468221.1 EamA/RhaT family transporter [Daejeonella sp.]